MGIERLDNTPRPVPGVQKSVGNSLDQQGSLDAMMLDMKRTFDEVVESQASPERAAQILANPFYVALSSSFSGTQEYMAMEKLGQLRKTGQWDLIVVDTPPARNALDFLDAPERLSGFLDGRFIRLLLVPAKGPARLMTAGVGMVTNTMAKIVGAQVLKDLQMFVQAFDNIFGGFRVRAQQTYELLQNKETAFLVVAAPEPDALREASYFVERLSADRMPLAGLVVNRASAVPPGGLSAEQAMVAAERLEATEPTDVGITSGLLRLHVDRMQMVAREARLRTRFAAAHPSVPTSVVPALSTDVHDLDGLRRIGELLAAQ
jgi:anion-transporting  ArsA/GET3 family ATPase